MIHQEALYLHSTPKGKSEGLLLFVVQRCIGLLLSMDAIEMQDIRAMTILCPYCRNTFGGQGWPVRCGNPSGPVSAVYNIRVACLGPLYTLSWPLLPRISVDFTSIETTLEQNQSPRVANVLVFKDHFTKHVLAYVTPDQTDKTVAKYLYQCYILIFGALARLLSDRGANFMSSVIDEMCKILIVKKLKTVPYHPQTNGLVEIAPDYNENDWEAGQRQKNWLARHLAEIVHAYNATCSTVTGYSLHYLMFGQRPRLPANFYFPTFRTTEALMRDPSTKCVDEYVATVQDWLRTTLREGKPNQQLKSANKNGTMTRR